MLKLLPRLEKKVIKAVSTDLIRYSTGKLKNLKTLDDLTEYLQSDVMPNIYGTVAERIWKTPGKYTLTDESKVTLLQYLPLQKKIDINTYKELVKNIKKGRYIDVSELKSFLVLQTYLPQDI